MYYALSTSDSGKFFSTFHCLHQFYVCATDADGEGQKKRIDVIHKTGEEPVIGMVSVTGITIMSLFSNAVLASNASAFIGGMVTSRVMQNMHQRTQSEECAAYSKPQATTAV